MQVGERRKRNWTSIGPDSTEADSLDSRGVHLIGNPLGGIIHELL